MWLIQVEAAGAAFGTTEELHNKQPLLYVGCGVQPGNCIGLSWRLHAELYAPSL
jgi:hypothetical protein